MVKMSKEILDVVNAVLTYKRFICSHNYLCPKENFDWYYETKKYYHSLTLPEGMKKNRNDFERILSCENSEDLKMLNNADPSDLHYFIWKV